MKKIISVLMALVLMLSLASCNEQANRKDPEMPEIKENEELPADDYSDAKKIVLSENGVIVDGKPAEESTAVTVGGEIIYYHDMDSYESGNPYGEGSESDKHTEEEAAEHILVTITEPGRYLVSGTMKGQLAIDLGEEAESDPNAKVTVILNGVYITCDIAPAVIFYNVYECADGENTSGDVDTAEAGANVIIADRSVNYVSGANVARIYKDNDEAKKLHKYDGAFYSKKSMNMDGGTEGTGVLNIEAKNEGLNSEMHLTVNGGNINISAQDDGINANEDGVSVITVNDGSIMVCGGLGTEGDGIDSNGWLTINGGSLYASGNGKTGDGGIDADMGITVNGGEVIAFGSRNDSVTALGETTCVQLSFASVRSAGSLVEFVDENGTGMTVESDREFQSLTLAGGNLEKNKAYRLYVNNVLQEYSGSGNAMIPGMGGFGGNFGRDDRKNAFEVPEGFSEWLETAENIPEDIRTWLEAIEGISDEIGRMQPGINGDMQMPEGGNMQGGPQGALPEMPENNNSGGAFIELSEVFPTEFMITDEEWSFYGISDSAEESRKRRVTFTVDGKDSMEDIVEGNLPGIKSIECSENIGDESIQLTLVYIGDSEEITVSEICNLSDGYEAVNALFDGLEAGTYRLTAAVVAENTVYTGSSSFDFMVRAKS